MSKAACWVEAVRLRTLPAAVAPVLGGTAMALFAGRVDWLAAALCLGFALAAQIAANFGNEYYDWRDGLDRRGRQGPRRGVTEGDIAPGAMLRATLALIVVAAAIGVWLIHWGGWWLLLAGALCLAAGPWPLSRHSLGEVTVVVFFGLLPVSLTYYVQAGGFTLDVLLVGLGLGLQCANILIVNNCRDHDDDRAAGKVTLVVRLGSRASTWLYLANGWVCALFTLEPWRLASGGWWAVPGLFLLAHTGLWVYLRGHRGAALTRCLGATALLLSLLSLAMFLAALTR